MVSKQPRKQRKGRFNAPLHVRHKYLRAPLSKELRERYGRKNVRVAVGDFVSIMRGDFVGIKGEVEEVSLKKGTIAVEGAISIKADGTEVARPIYPSNVIITKLDLKDEKRKARLSNE
ncbi:50S ribosomal protein L24 [Methanosalsum natronophilum]|uniref:Large ribosomal subunit protein uL24 n=1 Tax=Methanosalsum natronophilum TaxID=768733 RepID=A0A424YM76_9EURY|nr:50S ribosomal protein L24 [Methanosalsum natronophilum]MCS3924751.1 large subunit ribosomal protein L24 [Methanosalsum natronophilum]RQD80057.1 MAG: 50S ribosomal protein L24 [Methanosalsum natronophilum]